MTIESLQARRAALQRDAETLSSHIADKTVQLRRVEGAILLVDELIEEQTQEVAKVPERAIDEREPTASTIRHPKTRTTKNTLGKTA